MTDKRDEAARTDEDAVMRTFVRGRLAQPPEFARSMGGAAVCRLLVVGKARGPASSPPRVSLYIKDGEGEEGGLRGDEAERCHLGLREGDLIEAVGDVGPERPKARRQEVLVSERVKLWSRAASLAGAS
jgi:hypothetical protein